MIGDTLDMVLIGIAAVLVLILLVILAGWHKIPTKKTDESQEKYDRWGGRLSDDGKSQAHYSDRR